MKPNSNSQMGSHSQANPLKTLKWLFRPKPSPKTIETLKPIRKNSVLSPSIHETLNPIELKKALMGEMTDEHHGVLRLSFDIGIQNEIDSIARTLKDRYGRETSTPKKMGIGGQRAFSHYLNFFSPHASFTVQECRFQSSPKPKPYDFLIGFIYSKHEKGFFKIEVKTSPHGYGHLNYYKQFGTPYPNYVVAIKSLNEEMTKYELYGYTLGTKVKAHKSRPQFGKRLHAMALNRTNFDYYSYFHSYVLGLPFKEKFSD